MCDAQPIDSVTVRTDLEAGAVVLEIEDSVVCRFSPADARLVGAALVKCGECLEAREIPEAHADPR